MLRPKLFKTACERGKEITKVKERVRSSRYVNGRYSALVGMSIKQLFDKRFQAEFKNKIALIEECESSNRDTFSLFMRVAREQRYLISNHWKSVLK